MPVWNLLEWLFVILLVCACVHAALAGGRDGRLVSASLVAAGLLSEPAGELDRSWGHLQAAVLSVDLILLAGLVRIALRSRSYWPLWVTSYHLLGVATHVATIRQNDLRPVVYFALQAFWSLPMLLVMVIGIMADRRIAKHSCHDVRPQPGPA